ncbi:MAG: hypothetical protein EAX86_11190 [Candidatus Heimdallarchaeota archaeon]|nr:hypothetical protein [Candidatus Heimdallarchaeota archaeon]
MKKHWFGFFLVLVFATLVTSSLIVEKVSLQTELQTTKLIKTQVQVQVSLEKQLAIIGEQIGLSIKIQNEGENCYFNLKINGSMVFIKELGGIETFKNHLKSFILAAGESINISFQMRYETNDTLFLSSVQTFNILLFDNTTSETAFSATEWIWVYRDFNSLYKSHVSSKMYPLYANSEVLATYSAIMNETSSTGKILININNRDVISHNYEIIIQNETSLLRFADIFTEGYQCSLICSDRRTYYATFEYSFPEDSIWTILPFTIRFSIDSNFLIERTFLLQLQANQDVDQPIEGSNLKGKYHKNGDINEIIIFTKIPRETTRVAILTKNEFPNSIYYPDIIIRSDYFSFNISSTTLSKDLILFVYGTNSKEQFQIVNLQLVEVPEGLITPKNFYISPDIYLMLIFISLGIITNILIARKKYKASPSKKM